MKTYLGCKNESILRQTPYSFDSGHEQSVKEAQSRIFQARIQGNITDVYSLQKHLCDSFCAKLLATDYAINSVETRYINKAQSLIPSTACQQGLRGDIKQRGHTVPSNNLSHNSVVQAKELSQEHDTSMAKRFVRASQGQNDKPFSPMVSVPFAKHGFQTGWRVSIAKSLWSDDKSNQVTCDNTYLSAKKDFQKQRQSFQSRGSRLKEKKGKTEQPFNSLQESMRDNIRKAAQQIHALLALEPEWQAAFVLQRSQGKVVNDSIVSRCQNRLCKTMLCFAKRSLTTDKPQLFVPQSKAYVNVKPEFVIKQIRGHLEGTLPKYVVTVSIKEWLHMIDHQTLVNQLNTFPEMQKQVEGWLKGGVLQTDKITLQGMRDPFKRRVLPNKVWQTTCSRTDCVKLWRTPILKSKSAKLFLQAKPPSAEYSLYSVFPETLWEEVDRVYDVMQIENRNGAEKHVIALLLTRVVLHGLQEQVQRCADRFFLARFKHNALCLRQEKQLCFVSLKSMKCDFANKCFTRTEKKREGSTVSYPWFAKSKPSFLFSGYKDCFVMICSDKRFLEVCVSQAKEYLLQITCTNSKSNFKENQQDLLEKQNKSQVGGVDLTNCKSLRGDDQTNLFSTGGLGCDSFPSKNDFGLTEFSFSKIQDCRQGFSFLGFQIIQIQQQTLCACTITPSRESVRDLLVLITNKIRQSRSVSTNVWISRLNPLLLRWVEYYKCCEYKQSYSQISYLIREKTRTWLTRRKRKKSANK